MSRIAVVVVVLVLAAMPAAAWASPSLLGPTGLLLIPTAESLGTAQFDVGGSMEFREDADTSVLYANVGVLSGLEIGASRIKPEHVDAETMLNAKLRLPQPAPIGLSIAVGMIDITDEIDRTPYVVATHTIGAGMLPSMGPLSNPQVHVGIGGGQLDGLFGGFSIYYGSTQLIAEYDTNDVNVGAKIPIATKLDLTAAALGGLDDFAVGLSFASPW